MDIGEAMALTNSNNNWMNKSVYVSYLVGVFRRRRFWLWPSW